jgi:hypothetical protein
MFKVEFQIRRNIVFLVTGYDRNLDPLVTDAFVILPMPTG